MGWHYILTFNCKVLPEYIPFIKEEYLNNESYAYNNEVREELYKRLPKNYRDLIDIWRKLDIGSHFYEYDLKDDIFFCKISKKVNRHSGELRSDYEAFLKDIIVLISSIITSCTIESDDYGDCVWEYSDSQLRDIYFRLTDKIKKVEHVYNEDMTEIYETRVIYKHSIKKIQFLDLDRAYK